MSSASTRRQRDRPRSSDRRSDDRSGDRSAHGTHHDRPADRLRRRLGNQGLERALADRDRSDREEGAGHDRAVERVADLLAREAGRPLPPVTRREMATRFGRDFADVRVHDGPAAARTADELDAAAYTVGSDVVFAEEVDPARADGQWLLAHELAHVVQQDGTAPTDATPLLSWPGSPAERAADAAASNTLVGRTVTVSPGPGAVIARQQKDTGPDIFGIGKEMLGLYKSMFDTVLEVDKSQDQPNWYFHELDSAGQSRPGRGAAGFGAALGGLGEAFGRISEGDSIWNALGAGTTSGLTGYAMSRLGNEMTRGLSPWAKGSPSAGGVGTGLGLGSTALKMFGSLAGPGTAGDVLTGAGVTTDYASKVIAPVGFAQQGITEGVMSTYNTLVAGGESLFTGETAPIEDLHERNITGKSGDVIQGYTFIGEAISSLVSGDTSNLYDISSRASKGELGPLAEFGDWLGDVTYDAVETAETGYGMIGTLWNEGVDSAAAARLSEDAESGALGVLPQFGSELGDWLYEVTH